MEITIEEGRFVELLAPGATGMDRRAFGEFVGAGGELASYAIGWTTAADPHVAHMTIGLGAGNPGGATFHAVLFPSDGGYAFTLVDEPFEDVPEGGPDLTADAARAHPDVDFVWWVADCVMERDRRAWWMVHWLLGTAAIATAEVFALDEPVLLVSHDADDELWQLVGASGAGEAGALSHLCHAVDEDPTLIDVLDLLPGEQAERGHVGGPWARGACPPRDDA
jgi:hypothetical protein